MRYFVQDRSTPINIIVFYRPHCFCGWQWKSSRCYLCRYRQKWLDKINRDVLLRKLKLFYPLKKTFFSYLRGAIITLVMKFSYSKLYSVLSGGPQISALGPLLFALMLTDASSAIKSSSQLKFKSLCSDFKSFWKSRPARVMSRMGENKSPFNAPKWFAISTSEYGTGTWEVGRYCILMWSSLLDLILVLTLQKLIIGLKPLSCLGLFSGIRQVWETFIFIFFVRKKFCCVGSRSWVFIEIHSLSSWKWVLF